MKCDWSQAPTISTNLAIRIQSQRWQAIACSIRFMARMRWVGPVYLDKRINGSPVSGMYSDAMTSKHYERQRCPVLALLFCQAGSLGRTSRLAH